MYGVVFLGTLHTARRDAPTRETFAGDHARREHPRTSILTETRAMDGQRIRVSISLLHPPGAPAPVRPTSPVASSSTELSEPALFARLKRIATAEHDRLTDVVRCRGGLQGRAGKVCASGRILGESLHTVWRRCGGCVWCLAGFRGGSRLCFGMSRAVWGVSSALLPPAGPTAEVSGCSVTLPGSSPRR